MYTEASKSGALLASSACSIQSSALLLNFYSYSARQKSLVGCTDACKRRHAEQPPTSCSIGLHTGAATQQHIKKLTKLTRMCFMWQLGSGNTFSFVICSVVAKWKIQVISALKLHYHTLSGAATSRSGESKGASSFHINKIRKEVT